MENDLTWVPEKDMAQVEKSKDLQVETFSE